MTSAKPRPHVVVVTTDGIDGYRIGAILGAVFGVASQSSSPFREGLKSFVDGHSATEAERVALMSRARELAIGRMAEHAARLGANAVIAMHFDHRRVTDMWNEICAYGTAVFAVASARATPEAFVRAAPQALARRVPEVFSIRGGD